MSPCISSPVDGKFSSVLIDVYRVYLAGLVRGTKYELICTAVHFFAIKYPRNENVIICSIVFRAKEKKRKKRTL